MSGAIGANQKQANDVEMNPLFLEIVLEIVKAIVGVVIPALTIWLMFHTKRINDNVKMNSLQSRIDQLSQHSEQLQSFKNMTLEERVESLMQGARRHAMDNGINITDIELRIMVEGSLQSLRMLYNIGYQLQLKKELENGKFIKE